MNTNLKTIIVDDEVYAVDNLEYLLNNYCKNIDIVGTANHVDEAIVLIQKHQPDVVFLDIEMPEKSGFDLLKEIPNVNFSVIFVTAYNQYAIKAFEVSAIDYLLKPIVIERLKEAVNKVSLAIKNPLSSIQNIESLNKQFKEGYISQISIPYKRSYIIVKLENIICIEANQAYTTIYYLTKSKETKTYTYSKNLNYFEGLFDKNQAFFRCHRSWIINMSHIYSFSKKESMVTVTNNITPPISRRKIKAFEISLKQQKNRL